MQTPGLFNRYKTRDIYPVVLGGVDVIRCCHGEGSTGDIDIKFVISPKVSGKDDYNFVLACALRDKFLDELLQIANASGLLGPTTVLSKSDVDNSIPSARVAIYEELNNKKQIFIDTGIFCNMSMYMYENFANFFPDKLIPTYVEKNIPYATCSWTIVDTVRMIHYSKENMIKSNNASFWKKKYQKYIEKFKLLHKTYNSKSMNRLLESLPEAEELLKIQTNIDTIEERFVAKPDIDVCFRSILNYILEKTLSKYFMSHVSPSFYPILIGGVDVERCVKPMFKLDINDIDIQFVLKDMDANTMTRVTKEKQKLVDEIVTDVDVKTFISGLQTRYGLKIEISQISNWDVKHQHQKDMGLIIIEVAFKEPDSDLLLCRRNMIDVCIYSMDAERSLVDIPFEKINHVLYATCDFTFENTRHMIDVYQTKYAADEKKTSFNKYLRYICKYCALYMVRNQHTLTASNMNQLRRLYKDLYHIIRGIGLKDGKPEKRVYQIVHKIQEKTQRPA